MGLEEQRQVRRTQLQLDVRLQLCSGQRVADMHFPVFADLVEAIVKTIGHLSVGEEIDASVIHIEDERHDPFPLTTIQQAYLVGRTGVLSRSKVAAHDYSEFDGPAFDLARLPHSI